MSEPNGSNPAPYNRRAEDSPLQRNMASIRTILEGILVIVICWTAATLTQLRSDMEVVKTNNQYIGDMARDVPIIKLEVGIMKNDNAELKRRISDLEQLKKLEH